MIRKQNAKNKCGALCWQEGAETERIQGSAWGCQEHLRRHKWRDFKRQKGASDKFGLHVFQIFRKTTVSQMSLFEEKLVCTHNHEPPQSWRLLAEFVFLGKTKNMTNNWPGSRGFCWSWNQAYWTFSICFPFILLSQTFLKSVMAFGWALNPAMNWSRHDSFHRARNLLGFSNVCGCESGTEIILWLFMDLWETGVYERFGIGRLPLCRCLKKKITFVPLEGA